MPAAPKPEKKCPCGYDSIKLEDEVPVVPEVKPIEPPMLPGATLDDLDALKKDLDGFRNTMITLNETVSKHISDTDNNFKTIEKNMQFLAGQI